MRNPHVKDALVGVGLAVAGQLLQLGAYALLSLMGFEIPYSHTPSDPRSHPSWVAQINLMGWMSSVLVLAVTIGVALALKITGVRHGARHGMIWLASAAVVQAIIGLVEGSLASFTIAGTWMYLASFVIGPVLVGWIRAGLVASGDATEPDLGPPGGTASDRRPAP